VDPANQGQRADFFNGCRPQEEIKPTRLFTQLGVHEAVGAEAIASSYAAAIAGPVAVGALAAELGSHQSS
jgi:hypothetical protein